MASRRLTERDDREYEHGRPIMAERRQGMEQKSDNVLAHDLNNGLGVIAGYCELMVEDADPESECVKRLRLVLEVVHRLAARINEHERRIRFSEMHAGGQARSSSENRENRRCG